MNEQIKIATKVIFNELIKNESRELFHFHQKYNLSPRIIIEALSVLKKNDLVNVEGQIVIITPKIDNQQVATINKIMKTNKPKCLYRTMLDI